MNIDKMINKIINPSPSIKSPNLVGAKVKEMSELARSSIFFPFTEPTVRSPTGRLLKGHMPSMDRVMKNFGLKSFGGGNVDIMKNFGLKGFGIHQDKKSKNQSETFKYHLFQKGIDITRMTPEEQRQIQKEFRKRPEMIEKAKGIIFASTTERGSTAFYAPAVKSETVKPVLGQEAVVLGAGMFKKRKYIPSKFLPVEEYKQRAKIKGADLGKTIVHELEHRRQHQMLPEEELQKQRLEQIKYEEELEKATEEENIKQATEEKKQEFARKWYLKGRTKEEIEAIQAETKPRERDMPVPEEQRAEAFREVFKDEQSKNLIIADKPIIIKSMMPVKRRTIKKVYDKIPDDTSIPLVFQTKKQYLKEYIRNQEKIRGIDFTPKEEKQYIKTELKSMKPIIARYTTKTNKYIEPRVVVFTDNKMSKRQFKGSVWHEYGHELWEKNGLKGNRHEEEMFANNHMYKNIRRDRQSRNQDEDDDVIFRGPRRKAREGEQWVKFPTPEGKTIVYLKKKRPTMKEVENVLLSPWLSDDEKRLQLTKIGATAGQERQARMYIRLRRGSRRRMY